MAEIDVYLQQILSAIYGKDVRDAIHDSIEAINDDVHDFVRDGMDTTLTSTLLPAQGKAVGDAIEKGFHWYDPTIQSPNYDLDDVVKSGWYLLGADSEWANTPETVKYQRVVIVYRRKSDEGSVVHQLYFNSASGMFAFRVYHSNSWHDWNVLANSNDVTAIRNNMAQWRDPSSESPNMDLNELVKSGWYLLGANSSWANTPETIKYQRVVMVYRREVEGGSVVHQIYFNSASGMFAFRVYHSNSWHDWNILALATDITRINNRLNDGAMCRRLYADDFPEKDAAVTDEVNADITQWRLWRDLDDMIYPGWYTFSAAHKYLHAPVGTPIIENEEVVATYCTGHRVVLVVTNASGTLWHQIYFQHEGPVLAYRTAWGGSWKAWRVLAPSALPDNDAWMEMDDNTYFPYEDFVPTAQAGSASNTGEKVRIMSYNVQRYNYGTNTFIYDAPGKISNYRKVLNAADPDVVCIQEGFPYVDVSYDSGPGKSTFDYLYKPKYPHAYGHGITWNPIYSKLAIANTGCVRLPTYASAANPSLYRNIQYGVLTLGSKELLIMSIHTTWSDFEGAGTSAANKNARRQEYEGMMRWANGEITLPELTSKAPTAAPEHTHTVICMDGNISTDDDRANLTTLAAANNFTLGNGGAIGWVYTHVNASTHEWHSLDQIMVSDNVIIDNIEAWTSWYPKLYSDHCPLVADIVLL